MVKTVVTRGAPCQGANPVARKIMAAYPPVLVEVTRGGMVESRHAVRAAIADAEGTIVDEFGDTEALIYPRSAIKPIQALPLIETGAADACFAARHELALACASHTSEAAHVSAVAAWLKRLGLDETALECGAHRPSYWKAADALAARGATPTPLHNNCSGKHAGFLATAVHLGEDPRGYIGPDHPVQQRVRRAMESVCGAPLADAPTGVDGCGIPIYGMALAAFAVGLARMACADRFADAARAQAARRIVEAMIAAPEMVAGSERLDTDVMAAGDAIACKTGAEGVHAAILTKTGLGVACKAEDGAARAADAACAALMLRYARPDARQAAVLDGWAERPIMNAAGRVVGHVRAVVP
jgi:L-asparaginase II